MAKDKKKIEDMLGAEEPKDGQDLMTATPDGTNGDKNPLEKMDEISKAKPGKKQTDSRQLDDEVVNEMFKTGDNTDGMFTPKDEEEHEDEADEAKLKVGSNVQPSKKYEKEFKNDMLKHPDEYKVMTPRGEMTIAEAIRAGYNPMTKRFDKKHGQEQLKEKHLSQLNDADKAAIENLTNPAAAQVAPADAEKYGLNPGSPMIKGNAAEVANLMIGQGGPAIPAAAQATPALGGTPIGGALPGSEESMAPGAEQNADALAALLGGGQ